MDKDKIRQQFAEAHSCGDCIYWQCYDKHPPSGECHANPPQPNVDSEELTLGYFVFSHPDFPFVDSEDFCDRFLSCEEYAKTIKEK